MTIESMGARMNHPPRIFISADHGLAIVYFLQSDVVPTLLRAGVEVILLTDDALKGQIQERFSFPGLTVEGLRLDQVNAYARGTHPELQWWLQTLRRVGSSNRINTQAMDSYVDQIALEEGWNWYVVHTYSGFEEKVKIAIEEKLDKQELKDKISRVLIPTERVIELKGGKKKESDKKFYPGYILVEMELDDETWHLVRSTPRVTGFVGGAAPVALSDEEVSVIMQQIEKGPVPQVKTQFQKGESVRIIDGPFSNFIGSVDDIDLDHGRLGVMVSIFGRQTPV